MQKRRRRVPHKPRPTINQFIFAPQFPKGEGTGTLFALALWLWGYLGK